MTPQAPLKVLDTFLRGLKRLAGLVEELGALEQEVAGREAEALGEIIAHVKPLLPRLVRPVSVREPWLGPAPDDAEGRAHGLVLAQSFQQDRGANGRITHQGELLLLDPEGRLVELTAHGAWTETNAGGAVTDASWRVESHERLITPEVARRALRPTITGLLDALRDAIVRGRAERTELKRRLDLLQEVDGVLRRGGGGD